MNNTTIVQIFQPKDYFSNICLSPFFRNGSEGLDECSTITSIQVLHHEIQVILALECVKQLYDERRVCLLHEDHAFSFDISDLVLCNHIRLTQNLDRIIVTGGLLLSKEYRAESAFANGLYDIKILD